MELITVQDLEQQKNTLVKQNEETIQKVVEATLKEWNSIIEDTFIFNHSKTLWIKLYVTNTKELSPLLLEEVYSRLTSKLEKSGLLFKHINDEDDFMVRNPFMDRLALSERYNNI